MAALQTGPRRGRVDWIDAARGVALFSMFVAHTAPSGGPAGVLNLSEHLTAALFAALIGVSARLESERCGLASALVRALWRGAILVALTLLNAQFGAGVLDILGYLAVLTVVMALAARLPWAVRALLLGMLLATASWLQSHWGEGALSAALDGTGLSAAPATALQDLLAGSTYRLPSLLMWSLAGTLVLDWVTPGLIAHRLSRPRALLIGAAGAVVAVVVMVGIRWRRGQFLVPYTGETAELVFNTALVLLVLGTCAALVPLLPRALTALLTVPGSMTLSLYVAHTAFLGWVARHPGPWRVTGGMDDSWLVLSALLIGSLVFALLWRAAVRRAPWSAGPLEGPIRAVESLVHRR